MSKRNVVMRPYVRRSAASVGRLSDLESHELAGTVMKEAVKRSAVDRSRIPT
jgi:hypothetical protein